ncbi:MAG: archaemetzincin family Zn-dependent metalloprotease [Candidatus Latescibacteria bacterium]|jgi:archaemetzincin|nr:archaemetzincin family Zn-dependent metalloprotease [Candidatus Latescibacterota bacterium]
MVTVRLLRVGAVAPEMVDAVRGAVGDTLGCRVETHGEILDPGFAFDPERRQYNSTQILHHLEAHYEDGADRTLGLTEVDLFIPILTFVFGEALLDRSSAVVSLHRLRLRFYGLPEDEERLLHRVQTEAVHELGHTYGLIHCADFACAMHASRVADETDLKGPGFCADCSKSLVSKSLQPMRYRR